MTAWIFGLVGGVLIGCGAAVFLLMNGRIAGISGILGEVVGGRRLAESGAFVIGLTGVPAMMALAAGPTHIAILAPLPVVVLGGLLVGIGTRIGSGCTSGHGVCGLSRLSRRSLVATGTFMLVAAATVFVVRHVAGGG